MILKQLRHLRVNLALGERSLRRLNAFFQISLLLLIRVQDLQKLFINFWLALKTVLDFVDVIDCMIEFNGLRLAGWPTAVGSCHHARDRTGDRRYLCRTQWRVGVRRARDIRRRLQSGVDGLLMRLLLRGGGVDRFRVQTRRNRDGLRSGTTNLRVAHRGGLHQDCIRRHRNVDLVVRLHLDFVARRQEGIEADDQFRMAFEER